MAEQPEVEGDYLFKLLLVGDSGVGKSSILLRFTEDEFEEGGLGATIGVDFKVKMMEFKGKKLNLRIWDTAGQEKFRSLTSSYYRGTHGIILVYDVNSRESFDHVASWLSEVDIYSTHADVTKLLVGNKIDKEGRQVTKEEGAAFARKNAMMFIECSAKTKLGIQQAFEELVQKILETPNLLQPNNTNTKPGVQLNSQQAADQGGCYC